MLSQIVSVRRVCLKNVERYKTYNYLVPEFTIAGLAPHFVDYNEAWKLQRSIHIEFLSCSPIELALASATR